MLQQQALHHDQGTFGRPPLFTTGIMPAVKPGSTGSVNVADPKAKAKTNPKRKAKAKAKRENEQDGEGEDEEATPVQPKK